jgi:hypothetical protein
MYDMLNAWTWANEQQLRRRRFEKLELLTAPRRPSVRFQTRPPLASLAGWLRAALHTMFHATRR